jgi:hypothetical protein
MKNNELLKIGPIEKYFKNNLEGIWLKDVAARSWLFQMNELQNIKKLNYLLTYLIKEPLPDHRQSLKITQENLKQYLVSLLIKKKKLIITQHNFILKYLPCKYDFVPNLKICIKFSYTYSPSFYAVQQFNKYKQYY